MTDGPDSPEDSEDVIHGEFEGEVTMSENQQRETRDKLGFSFPFDVFAVRPDRIVITAPREEKMRTARLVAQRLEGQSFGTGDIVVTPEGEIYLPIHNLPPSLQGISDGHE